MTQREQPLRLSDTSWVAYDSADTFHGDVGFVGPAILGTGRRRLSTGRLIFVSANGAVVTTDTKFKALYYRRAAERILADEVNGASTVVHQDTK